MKTVEPYAWTGNPELAKDGRLGHWIKQTDTDTGQVVWKEISRAVMELQEGVERLYDEANRAADEALYFDMGKNSGKGVSLNTANNFTKQPTPQDLGDKK